MSAIDDSVMVRFMGASPMSRYVRNRVVALAVFGVMLLGVHWPPTILAQDQGVTLPAVNEHVKYNDNEIIDLKDNGKALDKRLNDIESWKAGVVGQMAMIEYGIGILIAIFGGQLGVKWADSRKGKQ